MVKSLTGSKPQSFSASGLLWGGSGGALNNDTLALTMRMFPKARKSKLFGDPFISVSVLHAGLLRS